MSEDLEDLRRQAVDASEKVLAFNRSHDYGDTRPEIRFDRLELTVNALWAQVLFLCGFIGSDANRGDDADWWKRAGDQLSDSIE